MFAGTEQGTFVIPDTALDLEREALLGLAKERLTLTTWGEDVLGVQSRGRAVPRRGLQDVVVDLDPSWSPPSEIDISLPLWLSVETPDFLQA